MTQPADRVTAPAHAPGPAGATSIADPGAAALLSFGMALLCVWVVEIITPQSRGVIAFGLLFAGLLQSIASILIFIRGDAYLGTLLAVFGTWLVAYHFFGMNERFGNPTARGWFALILEVACVMLAIPAVRRRIVPILLAFAFLAIMIFFLGMQLITGHEWMGLALGWSAFAAAIPILYLCYERLMAAVPPPVRA